MLVRNRIMAVISWNNIKDYQWLSLGCYIFRREERRESLSCLQFICYFQTQKIVSLFTLFPRSFHALSTLFPRSFHVISTLFPSCFRPLSAFSPRSFRSLKLMFSKSILNSHPAIWLRATVTSKEQKSTREKYLLISRKATVIRVSITANNRLKK